LGNEEYILPVHILGYKILVDATLNQPNFSPGDTVRLNLTIENRNERNLKGFSVANYNGEPVTQNFLLSGFAENIDFSNPEFIKAIVDSGVYVSPVLWLGNFDSLIVEPEGGGTFDFWTRIVEPDSIHYSNWISDSVIIGTDQALLLQFKVAFFDPMSNLERINVRLYDNATFKDTVIEEFNPVDLAQEFIFGFEPLVNFMFYGVYTETGRGLWLNTIYIFEANDTCNIITDKQVYYMGDTVYATVQSPYTGKLIWSSDFFPFGTISDSLWIDTLTEQFEFVLPEELSSGSYAIDFAFNIDGDTLQGFSAAQPFNVSGYDVQVFECRLDTNEYLPNDSMFIHFKLNSNKPIPLISKLRFVQNYQWFKALVDTIDIDSGFNVINMATVVPALERGIAFLSYSFYKDSIFLTHSQEGFMIYMPDTMPPVAQFIEVPENTYNPNTAYTVKITATDEMRMYDTLYYHNGYMQNRITHQTQKGDTLIYKIPSQPRGTHIAFYITVKDSFGNMVRLPEVDYKQFWVMAALPPSECETDTVNQNIEISWEDPSENLIYHSGYSYEERMDSIAVRFTTQYLPAELRSISVFAEKTIPDTAILSVSFHSVDAGIPGYEICPSLQIDVTEDGANWVEVQIDSIPVTEEIFIIFSAEDINLYGDGNKYVYRTLVKDDMWMADTAFGNLLAHTGCYYEPDSIFYLVMREDSSQFVLIADSLFNKVFTDSAVNGERRYRYLVKTHYIIPDLNSTSPILTQMYDYTPPLFGDSVEVIESDSGYFVGCEITDGIGIAFDSLIYNDIGISNDSIVDYWYWYTIPNTGQTIAYYFMAIDSAENTARNPDSGYFYIIPHIPEGFSGHITKDTTWSTDIVIKGDVWVDSGVVLTIDAGVNVRFVSNFDDEHAGIDTSRAEFIIIGDLTLLGNDSMHVTFTSNSTQPQTDDWYGIRFVELGEKDITIGEWESIPKKQTLVERKASETLLPCPVENEREDDNLEISDDELDKESIEKLVEEWRRRIDERCTGVLLENITIEYAKNGISFLRTGYFILRNSFIRDCCESGVNFEEEWGWVIMDSIVLERTNIGIKSEAPVWLFDGVITGCDSIGVYLSGWDGIIWESSISQNGIGILSSSYSFPYIWYTDLMGNSTGIFAKEDSRPWVRNSKIIGNSSYGIYITDNAKPNLGRRGLNYIFGSELYDLYNNTANRIVAKRNYWGTVNIDTVNAHIYDYYDNDSLGVVVVKPLWEGEGEQGIGGPMLAGDETTPVVYAFKSISPNPFCNSTTITYSIAKPGNVSIDIFDISGRLIKTLLTEMKDDRVYNVEWNGCDNLNRKLTTGVYFIRLTSGSFTSVKKIILVR
ncbi:T9SS type A sorting domain-containing protein, partial [candidate division WOR-3 bacterium]|nr:T9SS type A sorting domain-containing protein [candidate division WOR-3 bacterium]